MPSPEARIEAEFSGQNASPDPNGSSTDDVYIPASGLDIQDVRDIDYVEDAIEDGDEFRVYVKVSSDIHISST